MSSPFDTLEQKNIETADAYGLLDSFKLKAGAPYYYRYLTRVEFQAVKEAGIEVYERKDEVVGPVFDGFVHPDIRKLIDVYYRSTFHGAMPLTEFLQKIRDDSI